METLYEDLNIEKLKSFPDIVIRNFFQEVCSSAFATSVSDRTIGQRCITLLVQLDTGLAKFVKEGDGPSPETHFVKLVYDETKKPTEDELKASLEKIDRRLQTIMAMAIKDVASLGAQLPSMN